MKTVSNSAMIRIRDPFEFSDGIEVIQDAYILKGDIKFFLKDYRGAVKAYNKLLFFTDCCFHLENMIIIGYWTKNSIDDHPEENCRKIFQNYNLIINLIPFFAETYLGRGRLYFLLSDYNNAIQDYTKAINLMIEREPHNPNLSDAYDQIAEAYLYRGEDKSDMYHLGKGPEELKQYLYKGAYEELEEYLYEAIIDYTKAINLMIERDPLNPNLIQAYYGRAGIKEDLKDYRGAINDWSKIIELEPDDVAAYVSRSDNKFELNDYTGGIQDLNKVLEINPHHCKYRFKRATVKQKMGDYNGAILDYNKIIEDEEKKQCTGIHGIYIQLSLPERGLCKIKSGFKDDGCLDFSKAGELGSKQVYDYIKKYCN